MMHRKLWLVGLAGLALTLILGAGTASATKLYKYTTPNANDPLTVNQLMQANLETSTGEPGPSLRVKTTNNVVADTCTSSGIEWKIEEDAGTPKGAISAMTFTGCTEPTVLLASGSLEIAHIVGTTNGTVTSKGLEVTIASAVFGVSCIAKTGAGTVFGTLTGAKASNGKATIDVNATIAWGICGSGVWTGSYRMEEPDGLTVEAS